MLAIILFIVIIMSGSFLGAVVFKKKFEETLPITVFSLILILFLGGLVGNLETGIGVLFVLTIIIYGIVLYRLYRKRNYRDIITCLGTPGALVFGVAVFVFIYMDYGLVVEKWDEFSHWADIVKVMTVLDDFGTNPDSQSMFQAYPPGMALFEYTLQKIGVYLGNGFSEWKIYFAHQIFILAAVLPVFKYVSFKKPFHIVALAVVVILLPLAFFPELYVSVYVDAVLAILSGTGFIILWFDQEERWSKIYILFLSSVLVLIKDAGIVFALLLMLTMVLIEFAQKGKKGLLYLVAGVFAVMIPKFLWNMHIKDTAAVRAFSDSLNIGELIGVLYKNTDCYQRTVVSKFFGELFNRPLTVGETAWSVTYPVLFLTFILGLFIANGVQRKQEGDYFKQRNIVICMSVFQTAVYTIGLCFTYVLNFSKYEALQLASFERYLNIAFLVIWMLLITVVVLSLDESYILYSEFLVLITSLFLSTPWQEINYTLSRELVYDRKNGREAYSEMIAYLEQIPDKDAKIYLISQEDQGYDYWLLKFCVRPLKMNDNFTWSIGEPFYEDDIYTRKLNVDQWREQIKGYDYVALYRLNDWFYQNYAMLFNNYHDIKENTVYKVDKRTGMLDKFVAEMSQ